ncbi:LIM domain only protein 7b [Nerophis lumbriciformis]|uniref:LIM domain only protein 7b n=1 Tax=Nerophis lumbriciformis TaxID=546530 RepID=UPI002ADF9023|nr:LIM domain only protein 7-like [Nerophis lumbriciformis]
MEWRQQSTFSCADAFNEARRWIEEVTGKPFGSSDFRAALENGVLLCDLINQLKPGIIKKLNRLSTPIAGLDNVNAFLKACEKLGLNESQLFHPGDLQDLSTRATLRRNDSTRRLKNVLITVYWLGRKSHLDEFYSGPQLNFKAFEGLLGLALSKALDEGANVFVKDGVSRECCHPGRRPTYKQESSVDSVDSAESPGLRANSEGCGSDAEAEQVFRMETTQQSTKGHIPPPVLRRKRREESGKVCSTSFIRSKSLSDIPMVYPTRKVSEGNNVVDERQDFGTAEWTQDKESKSHIAARESEAHWQDDLTKWKNRRRSTKSDLRRKSLDREHVINKMTNGAVKDHGEKGNHGQLQRDQLSAQRHSPAPRSHSGSPPSKCSSSFFPPHTRAPLARSYATEVPLSTNSSHSHQNFSPTQASSVGTMPDSDGNILGEDTHFSSVPLNGTTVPTPTQDQPFSSQTQNQANKTPASFQHTTDMTVTAPMSSLITTLPNQMDSAPALDLSGSFGDVFDQKCNRSEKESHDIHSGTTEDESTCHPAVGSRKYLSRAASWSCSASLPRGFRRSEGSRRLSYVITPRPFGINQSRMSMLPRLSDEISPLDSQSPVLTRESEACVPLAASSLLKRQTATACLKTWQQNLMQAANHVEKTALAKEEWDSLPDQTNGVQHQSQIYLNMQPQRSQATALPCHARVNMLKVDCGHLRVSLALNSDSRQDLGFQPRWDATGARIKYIQPGGPAELCQLRVDDEILTVDGVAAAHMGSSLWEEKMASALQTGALTMDVCRCVNKGKQLGGMKTCLFLLKQCFSTFFEPRHIFCVDKMRRHTTSRNHKLFGSAKRLLQLLSGWLVSDHTGGEDAVWEGPWAGGPESAISDLQVPAISPSSSGRSWDRDDHRRRQEKWQEEQERLLQEQYERDQRRLDAEWQQARRAALEGENNFEMIKDAETPIRRIHVKSLTNTGETSPGELELNAHSRTHKDPNEKMDGDWADGSSGFAHLSPAHRTKSLSTPTLAGAQKQQRGDPGKRKGEPASKAAHERQQILEEMKKRTQLLTDNSWIRQRSSSFYKEPIYIGVPLKRHDSVDVLETSHSSSMAGHARPHSAAASYCGPMKNSHASTGSVSSHGTTPTDLRPGRRSCCVCEGVLTRGAAMVIEALSLCFHFACFQCVGCQQYLGKIQKGVQVRVRDKKPYCETCYFKLKSSSSTSV